MWYFFLIFARNIDRRYTFEQWIKNDITPKHPRNEHGLINIRNSHCSLCLIFCGTTLNFSQIINNHWTSLFFLKIEKKKKKEYKLSSNWFLNFHIKNGNKRCKQPLIVYLDGFLNVLACKISLHFWRRWPSYRFYVVVSFSSRSVTFLYQGIFFCIRA